MRKKEESTFFILEKITEESTKDFVETLWKKVLNKEKDPITLVLNTTGGNLIVTYGIIDLLELYKGPITTIVTGYACSSGALIFMAGDKRLMTKRSLLMLHHMTVYFEGPYPNTKSFQKSNDIYYDLTLEHILKYSQCLSEKEIKAKILKSEDNWLSPKESIELGLCDKII